MLQSYYFLKGDQKLPRGLSKSDMKKWKGASPDPFETEEKIKELVAPSSFVSEEIDAWIEDNIAKAYRDNDKHSVSAWTQRKIERAMMGKEDSVNQKFFTEFIAFLLGKVDPYSHEYELIRETCNDPSQIFREDGVPIEGGWKIDEQPPIGRTDEYGEEIRKYIQTFTDRHFGVIRKVIDLKLNGPRSLRDHWIYFKYILKGGIKDFGTKPIPELFTDFYDPFYNEGYYAGWQEFPGPFAATEDDDAHRGYEKFINRFSGQDHSLDYINRNQADYNQKLTDLRGLFRERGKEAVDNYIWSAAIPITIRRVSEEGEHDVYQYPKEGKEYRLIMDRAREMRGLSRQERIALMEFVTTAVEFMRGNRRREFDHFGEADEVERDEDEDEDGDDDDDDEEEGGGGGEGGGNDDDDDDDDEEGNDPAPEPEPQPEPETEPPPPQPKNPPQSRFGPVTRSQTRSGRQQEGDIDIGDLEVDGSEQKVEDLLKAQITELEEKLSRLMTDVLQGENGKINDTLERTRRELNRVTGDILTNFTVQIGTAQAKILSNNKNMQYIYRNTVEETIREELKSLKLSNVVYGNDEELKEEIKVLRQMVEKKDEDLVLHLANKISQKLPVIDVGSIEKKLEDKFEKYIKKLEQDNLQFKTKAFNILQDDALHAEEQAEKTSAKVITSIRQLSEIVSSMNDKMKVVGKSDETEFDFTVSTLVRDALSNQIDFTPIKDQNSRNVYTEFHRMIREAVQSGKQWQKAVIKNLGRVDEKFNTRYAREIILARIMEDPELETRQRETLSKIASEASTHTEVVKNSLSLIEARIQALDNKFQEIDPVKTRKELTLVINDLFKTYIDQASNSFNAERKDLLDAAAHNQRTLQYVCGQLANISARVGTEDLQSEVRALQRALNNAHGAIVSNSAAMVNRMEVLQMSANQSLIGHHETNRNLYIVHSANVEMNSAIFQKLLGLENLIHEGFTVTNQNLSQIFYVGTAELLTAFGQQLVQFLKTEKAKSIESFDREEGFNSEIVSSDRVSEILTEDTEMVEAADPDEEEETGLITAAYKTTTKTISTLLGPLLPEANVDPAINLLKIDRPKMKLKLKKDRIWLKNYYRQSNPIRSWYTYPKLTSGLSYGSLKVISNFIRETSSGIAVDFDEKIQLLEKSKSEDAQKIGEELRQKLTDGLLPPKTIENSRTVFSPVEWLNEQWFNVNIKNIYAAEVVVAYEGSNKDIAVGRVDWQQARTSWFETVWIKSMDALTSIPYISQNPAHYGDGVYKNAADMHTYWQSIKNYDEETGLGMVDAGFTNFLLFKASADKSVFTPEYFWNKNAYEGFWYTVDLSSIDSLDEKNYMYAKTYTMLQPPKPLNHNILIKLFKAEQFLELNPQNIFNNRAVDTEVKSFINDLYSSIFTNRGNTYRAVGMVLKKYIDGSNDTYYANKLVHSRNMKTDSRNNPSYSVFYKYVSIAAMILDYLERTCPAPNVVKDLYYKPYTPTYRFGIDNNAQPVIQWTELDEDLLFWVNPEDLGETLKQKEKSLRKKKFPSFAETETGLYTDFKFTTMNNGNSSPEYITNRIDGALKKRETELKEWRKMFYEKGEMTAYPSFPEIHNAMYVFSEPNKQHYKHDHKKYFNYPQELLNSNSKAYIRAQEIKRQKLKQVKP